MHHLKPIHQPVNLHAIQAADYADTHDPTCKTNPIRTAKLPMNSLNVAYNCM